MFKERSLLSVALSMKHIRQLITPATPFSFKYRVGNDLKMDYEKNGSWTVERDHLKIVLLVVVLRGFHTSSNQR